MHGNVDTGLKPTETNGFPEHSKSAVALSIWIPLGPFLFQPTTVNRYSVIVQMKIVFMKG